MGCLKKAQLIDFSYDGKINKIDKMHKTLNFKLMTESDLNKEKAEYVLRNKTNE